MRINSIMNMKYISIIIILAVIVGGGILVYRYGWLQKGEVKMPKVEAPKKEGVNIQKSVGNFLLSVTDIRRISNEQARPYLNTDRNKDVLVLDLLFVAGRECTQGCYISTLINDYKLTTAEGFLKELGEYSTKWESAPFLNLKYSGNQALKPGDKGEHQAYFFISPDDKDFIFTYTNSASQESQSYQLKLE